MDAVVVLVVVTNQRKYNVLTMRVCVRAHTPSCTRGYHFHYVRCTRSQTWELGLNCCHYREHLWECWWTDPGTDQTTTLDSRAPQSQQLTTPACLPTTHIRQCSCTTANK